MEKRAGWFVLIVSLLSFGYQCSVSLLHSFVGWYAVWKYVVLPSHPTSLFKAQAFSDRQIVLKIFEHLLNPATHG